MTSVDCTYLEEIYVHAGGSAITERHCSHPERRGPHKSVATTVDQCLACTFGPFAWPPSPQAAVDGFSPTKFYSSTREQFAERFDACNSCPSRRGNWCLEVQGCELLKKLSRERFQCPLKRF